MKRSTITIPDDLVGAVGRYIRAQEVPPTLTAVVQAALRAFLIGHGYVRAPGPLRVTPARRGSGCHDVSRAHDRDDAAR